jgi:hypothetical protein
MVTVFTAASPMLSDATPGTFRHRKVHEAALVRVERTDGFVRRQNNFAFSAGTLPIAFSSLSLPFRKSMQSTNSALLLAQLAADMRYPRCAGAA